MKKFIVKLLIFFLPFAMLGIPGYIFAQSIGEIENINIITEAQRENHNTLLGLAYNESTPYYKKINANYYKKDVIALGTSRVMQFSSEYFNGCFYNCGGSVSGGYNEYINFLKNLDYTPKVIIIGLDQWVFNYAWSGNSVDYSKYEEIIYSPRNNSSIVMQIYRDLLLKKWDFDKVNYYPDNFGMNGRVNNNGFTWDGTYYYGESYINYSKTKCGIQDTLERIETGKKRFEYGDDVSEITLTQLNSFLEYCNENEIYVIGFLPPFSPVCYDAMISYGNHKYINKIYSEIAPFFEKYCFELYDFSDGGALLTTDDYYIDGFHGSSIVYNLIIQNIIKRSSELDKYINKERLYDLFDNRYNNLTFEKPLEPQC